MKFMLHWLYFTITCIMYTIMARFTLHKVTQENEGMWMKMRDKNTCRMIKSVAHLTSLPYITLKLHPFLPQHRDILYEKVKLFPFKNRPKVGCQFFSKGRIKKWLWTYVNNTMFNISWKFQQKILKNVGEIGFWSLNKISCDVKNSQFCAVYVFLKLYFSRYFRTTLQKDLKR